MNDRVINGAARVEPSRNRSVITSLADYLPSGKRVALRLPFGGARDKREQLVTPVAAASSISGSTNPSPANPFADAPAAQLPRLRRRAL